MAVTKEQRREDEDMRRLFASTVGNAFDAYLSKYQEATNYAVSNLQKKHLELWPLKQLHLFTVIQGRISDCIDAVPHLDDCQKLEMKMLLAELSRAAFPLFVAGMDANPIHHNVQTVENVLLILSRDQTRDYPFLKNAVILALLHDIGNGLVDPGLKKVKSSDIADRTDEMNAQGCSDGDIEQEVTRLIEQGSKYRAAHMDEGAKVAREILGELKVAGHVCVSPNDIDKIAFCIERHDNPSIAEYYSVIHRPFGRELLIPLDNALAYLLREADRLWMVSSEGVEKDLFDDLRKKPDKAPDALGKVRNNFNRFKDEFKLYEKAKDVTREELETFQHHTLFRTGGGIRQCQEYLWTWLCQLKVADPRKEMEELGLPVLDKQVP